MVSNRTWGGASLWTMMCRVGRRGVSCEGTGLLTDVVETLSMRAHPSDTIQSRDAKRHGMGIALYETPASQPESIMFPLRPSTMPAAPLSGVR